jgi:hypothetical protein
MALPMNTMPLFNMTIPSSGKKVKFRPFVVKEEKALLVAQQSEDTAVMINTLKDCLANCIRDDIDINELAIFDLEYMFLQVRAKSVGETVDLLFSCDVDHGEQNDKAKVKVILNLQDIEVRKNPEHTNNLKLFGDVGVILKYPTLEITEQMESMDKLDDMEEIFKLIANSIDRIYDGDDVYYAKETSKEELMDFLNNLTSEQFVKIQKFYETMPKLTTEVNYKCPLCGKEHHKVLEGLANFF